MNLLSKQKEIHRLRKRTHGCHGEGTLGKSCTHWTIQKRSSVYSCHLFLISSASIRSIPFLSFIVPIFARNIPLVSLVFLTRSHRQSAWWTMDRGSWHCTGDRNQDHSQEKEMQKSKMAVWGGLKIAVKRREVKSKGEKERYKHLKAEFRRIARRDKKAFLSGQCKEMQRNRGKQQNGKD